MTITTDPDHPALQEADAVLATAIPESVLRRATSMRFLGVSLAGVDHLPADLLRTRGVVVASAHTNGIYVAERALALILGFLGNIAPFDRDLRAGIWHGFANRESADASWHSLRGMTVALLGTGSIGMGVARLLEPFDCTLKGYRRTAAPAQPPLTEVTTHLHTAVAGADVVVCSLPLTEATTGLLDHEAFRAMRGALFVNVGRGAIADEAALFDALQNGTLRGAAIDTWYRYPRTAEDRAREFFPAEHPFHTLDNILLSPHLGGYTPQATAASLQDVMRQLDIYIASGYLEEAVDLENGY